MKTLLVACLLVLSIAARTYAQRADDTSHYRTVPVPAHLMPIERTAASLGTVYFYGGKRLSSPFALEVPFYELNDPTVNHHFRTFRTLTTLSRLTSLATLAYVLFSKNGSNSTYWIVYGSSIGASLTLAFIGNGHVNKAVTRYNEMLRQPRLGMSVAPIPLTGSQAIGVGIACKF
ncbi:MULTISPECIES: hypothetical protein [Spirosoma]|uniref:DUF5683 domain-containing protein n=1 Tax=Spirosoma liriopis TaxID=2937440 RepID=A0ABT0HGY0_9BACT|nr:MULTISPECIES: hypothetical protein [Spirosoma]MCK8491411.1 hypothetical protein [Spirosoma liriopis]UHG90781.1 hypothetical protein LQ777_21365 [Spirosoma oryzicola]